MWLCGEPAPWGDRVMVAQAQPAVVVRPAFSVGGVVPQPKPKLGPDGRQLRPAPFG
jgi:hypothetical protein